MKGGTLNDMKKYEEAEQDYLSGLKYKKILLISMAFLKERLDSGRDDIGQKKT